MLEGETGHVRRTGMLEGDIGRVRRRHRLGQKERQAVLEGDTGMLEGETGHVRRRHRLVRSLEGGTWRKERGPRNQTT